MICTKCGHDVPDEKLFCPHCGTPVIREVETYQTVKDLEAQQKEKKDRKQKESEERERRARERAERRRAEEEAAESAAAEEKRRAGERRRCVVSILVIAVTVVLAFLLIYLMFRVIPNRMKKLEADTESRLEAAAEAYAEAARATPVPVQNIDKLDVDESETASEAGGEESTAAEESAAESVPQAVVITPPALKPPYATDTAPADLTAGGVIPVTSALATTYLVQDNPFYNNEAHMAADGSETTSWQEADAGDGTGQQLQLRFGNYYYVKYIELKLGNWRNSDSYRENNRPSSLTLSFGGESYTFSFSDQMTAHYICFEDYVNASALTLTINSVYAGTSSDCCISEVTLYAGL